MSKIAIPFDQLFLENSSIRNFSISLATAVQNSMGSKLKYGHVKMYQKEFNKRFHRALEKNTGCTVLGDSEVNSVSLIEIDEYDWLLLLIKIESSFSQMSACEAASSGHRLEI